MAGWGSSVCPWTEVRLQTCFTVCFQRYLADKILISFLNRDRTPICLGIKNQRPIGRPVSLTSVLRICWIRTNLEIQEHSMLYKLSPIQKHQEEIWPCHKTCHGQPRVIIWKYSSVFRENRCPPSPKPVYGGNFSHEAVTLKIRSRHQNLICYSSCPIYIGLQIW